MKIKMPKIILMTMLVALGTSAMAEWTKTSPYADVIGYVDLDTISKQGDLVKMWSLFDYKTPHTKGKRPFLSSKIKYMYDCKGERSRQLAAIGYSLNRGDGQLVYSFSFADWTPVKSGTIGEMSWKIACGRFELGR
jgi:hypothetical protein